MECGSIGTAAGGSPLVSSLRTAHPSASSRAGSCHRPEYCGQSAQRCRRAVRLNSEGNGISKSGINFWLFRDWGEGLRRPGWREQIVIQDKLLWDWSWQISHKELVPGAWVIGLCRVTNATHINFKWFGSKLGSTQLSCFQWMLLWSCILIPRSLL